MRDTADVQCPYCFEWVEIQLDPESQGLMVEDCPVCCNPWQLRVQRSRSGDLEVRVERLQ